MAVFAGLLLFLGAFFGFILTPRVPSDSALASECQGCLSCIATAMHHYHEKYGHFPPAYLSDRSGRPMHSWRVLLLEFLEPELYKRYDFNEPWNGPNNRKLEKHMPNYFACPSDPDSKHNWRTNYFVVIGETTVFPGSKTVSLEDLKNGRDSTILIVESVGQNIHWMEPKDLSLDSLSLSINDTSKPSISSKHKDGPSVCMVDCSKQRLTKIAPEKLKEMLTIKPNGGKK